MNLDRTPVYRANAKGDVKRFTYVVDVAWDSAAIADIAKKRGGIDEIYYADLETLSVLWVWHQYTVHIYGREAARN